MRPFWCLIACVLSGAALGAPPTLDTTGSTKPAPTEPVAREGCVTAECHPGIKQRRFLHGPVHVNACDSCHTATDPAKHTFEPARSRHELCQLCHMVEVSADASKHEPFIQGECLSCHDPHGSSDNTMLRGKKYADACTTCHQDVTGAHDTVHGPASAGACGACHAPHASIYPKLLHAQGRDLCLRCHLATQLELESHPVRHEPVLGDCRICHAPHATDTRALLVADPSQLCVSCHADIAEKVAGAKTQHQALTTQKSCLNCHAAHAGDRSHLLLRQEKDLCLDCHNKVIKLDDGTKLTNMKDVLEKRSSLHGVLAEQSCSVCHEIHGSDNRRLLTSEYPAEIYTPFNEASYALCFACHDRQIVLQPKSTNGTTFRNGDTNLHYVHVNREEKGRSCKVCHDAHASNRARHIREEVPFGPGGWKLPIKYEQTPDGGRCGPGCHAQLEYNRNTPVVYPFKPGDKAWKGVDLVPGVRADTPDAPPENPK